MFLSCKVCSGRVTVAFLKRGFEAWPKGFSIGWASLVSGSISFQTSCDASLGCFLTVKFRSGCNWSGDAELSLGSSADLLSERWGERPSCMEIIASLSLDGTTKTSSDISRTLGSSYSTVEIGVGARGRLGRSSFWASMIFSLDELLVFNLHLLCHIAFKA